MLRAARVSAIFSLYLFCSAPHWHAQKKQESCDEAEGRRRPDSEEQARNGSELQGGLLCAGSHRKMSNKRRNRRTNQSTCDKRRHASESTRIRRRQFKRLVLRSLFLSKSTRSRRLRSECRTARRNLTSKSTRNRRTGRVRQNRRVTVAYA